MIEVLGIAEPTGPPHLLYAEEISVEIWALHKL
jgi:hypothetical protein